MIRGEKGAVEKCPGSSRSVGLQDFLATRSSFGSAGRGPSDRQSMLGPRLRPKLHSILPGRAMPETSWPRCRSTDGVQGTRLKPSPSSIMANRPEAKFNRCRYTPATNLPTCTGREGNLVLEETRASAD